MCYFSLTQCKLITNSTKILTSLHFKVFVLISSLMSLAVQTTLKFTYSEKYPDEAPLYEIFAQLNLEDNDVADILKLLALQVRK